MKLGRRGRKARGGGPRTPFPVSQEGGGGEARLMRQKEQQREAPTTPSLPPRDLSLTSGGGAPLRFERGIASTEQQVALIARARKRPILRVRRETKGSPLGPFRGKALSPLWGKRRKRGGGERRSRDAIFSPYFYDPPFISYNNTWKAEVGRKKPRGKRGGNKGRRRKSQGGGRGATVPNKILTSPKGEKGAERKEERCEEDPASR